MAKKTWVGTDSGNEGDINVAANWSPSGVPTTSDDVYFDSTSTQAVTGSLTALSAVVLSSVVIDGATYAIGTTAGYLELASPVLHVRSTTGTTYLDFGSVTACAMVVDKASNLNVIGDTVNHTLDMNGGTVNIAVPRGDSALVQTISKRAGTLVVGEDVTLTTLNNDGGSTTLNSGGTTITMIGGTVTTRAGTWTTINCDGGNLFPNSNGTITTLNIDTGGIVDMTKSVESRTVTTLNLDGAGSIHYDDSYVTITTKTISAYGVPTKVTITQ
jgi:hypothetical protein